MLSNVPKFTQEQTNEGLYFTMLIDVLYDNENFICSNCPEDLFPHNGPLALGFERTYSRLIEMQSAKYHED